jgi:ketosteroid isomerase-like protein
MLIAPGEAQHPEPAKALRESLLDADRALSQATFRNGIKAALAGAMAEDALLLYEGAPIISGKENAIKLLEAQPILNEMRMHWLPLVVTTSHDGSLGATWGVTSLASTSPDSVGVTHFARYISAWRRSANGKWQLAAHVDLGLVDVKTVIPKIMSRPARDPLSGKGESFAKADIDFARRAGVVGAPTAFAEFAAPDAMTLAGDGEVVIGPPAIKARMLESAAASSKWKWHPVFSDGSADGNLGFTVGEATITERDLPGQQSHGKYLTIWRRQSDGSVRFIVDGGNSR